MDLSKYIGNSAQLGYSRHYELTQGLGRGMRAVDVSTGAGLQYTVLPDRGMDISLTTFKGVNLVYLTPNTESAPAFYEPQGIGWLRTFNGGLLTTCGLTHLGLPTVDNGETLGLHGRYSTQPAKQFADISELNGSQPCYRLKGTVEEAMLLGDKLRLEREITSFQGENRILITDFITNFGFQKSPYTILYHFNFGYPLLSEHTLLEIDKCATQPRDKASEAGIETCTQLHAPAESYQEQVFFHTLQADEQQFASVRLKNPELGIALTVRIHTPALPYLTQWKMLGYGDYVLGIEPSNVFCQSREVLRKQDKLPFLEPGEVTTNRIELLFTEL
jgi:hypothetical protein